MRTRTLFLAFFSLALFTTGCGADLVAPAAEPDAGPQLAQGLTVLDVQKDFSFTAAFVQGEDVIYLQAVRGRPTPAEYRNDPSVPLFETDARITDKEGRLLYVRRGGDDFVDPTWEDDLLFSESLPPSATSNRRHLEMAAAATKVLEDGLARHAGVQAAATLFNEVIALREFGATVPQAIAASDEAVRAHVAEHGAFPVLAGGGGTDGPEDAMKYLDAGWYFIAVHQKDISFTFGTGKHSATRIHKYNTSNGAYTYFDFCNHGTCAGSMGEKCRLIMIDKPAWTAMTCNTEYNTWSNSPGHNCHDDTRVQMAAFVYGPSMARNQYWCNDGDSDVDLSGGFEQGGSPDCNEGTDTGYNHPSMLNYSASYTYSATQSSPQFSLILAGGATYQISTCGKTSTDTYLRLKDAAGSEVAYNDDDYGCGYNRASTINVTPNTSGTYTLHAGCYSTNACNAKVWVKLVSSASPPPPPPPPPRPANYYEASYTYSATQNTVPFWFWLDAGYAYSFSTCGTSATDTFLRLQQEVWDYDYWYSYYSEVAYNDDACGLQSTIAFTAYTSGWYVVQAGCYSTGWCDGAVNMTITGYVGVPYDPYNDPYYY